MRLTAIPRRWEKQIRVPGAIGVGAEMAVASMDPSREAETAGNGPERWHGCCMKFVKKRRDKFSISATESPPSEG